MYTKDWPEAAYEVLWGTEYLLDIFCNYNQIIKFV